MEQLDNKIKDIYNQEHAPLPDELKWEEMKDGIFEKMDNQEDEPTPFFVFSNGLKFLLVAMFLIFASASIYLFVNNFEKKRTASSIKSDQFNKLKNKSTTFFSIKDKSKIKSNYENKSTLKQNNLVAKNAPIIISEPNKKESTIDSFDKKTALSNTLVQSEKARISTKKQIKPTVNNNPNSERKSETSNKIGENNYLVVNHSNAKNVVDVKSIDNKNKLDQTGHKNEIVRSKPEVEKFSKVFNEKKSEISTIEPLIKKNSDLLKYQKEEKINPIVNIPIIEKPCENKLTSSAIKLHGGVTYMKSPFRNTDEAQYKSETGFVAYYADASYNRILANGFYLSLGISYNRLKTKFELNDTIRKNYWIENAETKRVRNVLTGKVIRTERNDVQVAIPSSREVRHYNKFDAWSMPVLVGKQWAYKYFSWNVGIGSEISIYNWSEGKTLRANEVIEYSRTEFEPYHKGMRVATLAETGIGLHINNHIEIITNFRYKKHLRNWSADEFIVKPNVFLLGTGVKFKF